MRYLLVWVLLFSQAPKTLGQNNVHQPPLRVGVVGLVHGHVHWILDNTKKSNIEIVGIAEPNRELAERLTRRYGLSMDLVFDSLDEMVKATRPEAVNAFNSTYGHLETVRYCAPQGIHVMVEKPLAVSWAHAREMAALAKKHDIHLLTNYETSWYGSNKKAYELIHGERAIGPMRKIVFHTGHMGPEEIGCSKEFLEWLTDPVLNGGGALTRFWLLWRQFVDLADEGRDPRIGNLHHPTAQTGTLPQSGRRRYHHSQICTNGSNHPGLLELAPPCKGHGSLRHQGLRKVQKRGSDGGDVRRKGRSPIDDRRTLAYRGQRPFRTL